MSLPTWLPGFTRKAYNYQGLGFYPAWTTRGGATVAVATDSNPCLLLHSTEGPTLPTYGNGKANPNFTIDPWRRQAYQHVPCNVASRALVKHNERAVQVEIVGYCDAKTAASRGQQAYLLDHLTDAQLTWLGSKLREIGSACGIPAQTSVTWKAYNSGQAPSSYGTNNGVRLNATQFAAYQGWLGHQHAPGNVHGDPGDLDVRKVLRLSAPAKPAPAKPAPGTTTVPKRVLKVGTAGADVRWLQAGLKARYPSYAGKLATDGVFGNATRDAVKEWQHRVGLTPDGIVGPATLARLKKEWNV